jgi:uncharacterized protein DUF1302/sporulation related protein
MKRRATARWIALCLLLASADCLADYVVQVAAFADQAFLAEASEKLVKAGFPVVTEKFAPRYGKPLTRLLVGPYRDRKEAEAVAAKLAQIGWPGYLRPYTAARSTVAPVPSPIPPPPPPVAARIQTPPPASTPAPAEEAPPPPPPAPEPEKPAEAPAAPVAAEPAGEPAPAPIKVHGFFLSEAAYTTPEPRHWSKWRNTFELNLQGKAGEQVSWKLGGRAFYDGIYDLTDFYPDAVRRDQRFEAMFRETYVDISLGNLDLRLGRQQIVWGEVVGLFFADIVSAKDLRDFIARDFDLLRIPQWAARLELTKGDFHAEAIGIPVMSYDDIGVPGSEFYPYPPPVPGFTVLIARDKKPPRTLENSSYGLRLSALAGGFDVSGFYYDSVDATPAFFRRVVMTPTPTLVYEPGHARIRQAGATVSKDFSSVIAKAEAVFTAGRLFPVTRLTDADGVVPKNTLDAVVGLEYSPGDWRFNLQVFGHWFPSYDTDLLVKRLETGATVLVARKLFGQKLEPEVLFIRSFQDQGWMVRAHLAWQFLPAFRFLVGGDLFGGPRLGFFGRYDRHDRATAELRYTF